MTELPITAPTSAPTSILSTLKNDIEVVAKDIVSDGKSVDETVTTAISDIEFQLKTDLGSIISKYSNVVSIVNDIRSLIQ